MVMIISLFVIVVIVRTLRIRFTKIVISKNEETYFLLLTLIVNAAYMLIEKCDSTLL